MNHLGSSIMTATNKKKERNPDDENILDDYLSELMK